MEGVSHHAIYTNADTSFRRLSGFPAALLAFTICALRVKILANQLILNSSLLGKLLIKPCRRL